MNRQEAIETLELFKHDCIREGTEMCNAIDTAIASMKQLEKSIPSPLESKPEVRRAYWEPSEVGEYHCTYCGAECDIDQFHKALLNQFCGKCGAKMY